MVFKIISANTSANGLNIVPFIGENGIQWQLNAIDSADAGRDMTAKMHRGLVGYKARGDISCLWMDKADVVSLLQAIAPEYVTVITDTLPWTTETVTMEMYSNNQKATCLTEYTDGNKLYGDVEFPLIER